MQERVEKATKRNQQAIAGLQGRLVTAAAGAWAMQRSVGGIVRPAVAFESAMADIGKVSDFDDAGLQAFGKQLRRLAASEIPMAVNELAALAANAAQSGVADADLFDFTKLTAKAAVAWGMSGAAAGENLAKLRSALGLTNDETSSFADAINHLSDNTAASAGDIVDYARRVAAQGEFFGFGKEQSIAFGAAMVGAGAQADVAATSFRNMGNALTRGAGATARQRSAYKALGLDARKVSKAMQEDATGTTLAVMERIGKLSADQRGTVMRDLFGDEARALAPLLNRLDILKDALKLVAAEQEYANSVGKEFATRAATTEFAMQRFGNQIKDVALALSGSLLPAMKDGFKWLAPYLLQLSDFAERNSKLIVGIGAVTAGLIALNIAGIGAALGARFAYGGLLMLAKGALAFAKPLAWTIGALAGGLSGVIRHFRQLRAFSRLAGKGGVFSLLASDMGLLARSALGLVNPKRIIAGLFRLGVKGAVLAAVLVTIGNAVRWLVDNGSKLGSAGSGFWKGLTDNLELPESLKSVTEGLKGLFNLLPDLKGSDQNWADWGAGWGKAAAEGINGLIGTIQALVGWIDTVITKAGEAASAIGSMFSRGGDQTPANSRSREIQNRPWEGQRSRGGRVSKGTSYLVGEQRPEIFTPGQSGYVSPRVASGSGGLNVTVTQTFNIDGASDPTTLIARVKREFESAVREGLRGVQADFGHSY